MYNDLSKILKWQLNLIKMPLSIYKIVQAKKTLAKLEELIKSEENKPDILLSREPNLGISGPGEVSTYGYYWEAKLMENENISASCSWFNAPIRAIKKVIKRRDFVGKYINTIKDSTIK